MTVPSSRASKPTVRISLLWVRMDTVDTFAVVRAATGLARKLEGSSIHARTIMGLSASLVTTIVSWSLSQAGDEKTLRAGTLLVIWDRSAWAVGFGVGVKARLYWGSE
jgi:hypothetical protein